MADYPVWGIHITNTAVRGIKLEMEGESLRVVAHDQIDFSEDIEDLASLQRFGAQLHALAVFSQRHDLLNSRIWVSIEGTTAFNRFVEVPVVSGESLAKILEYESQQQIPFRLDEVYWDHKVLSDVENRSTIEAMIFAIKREVVEERMRKLQKMRFPFDGFQLAPVALYNFAAYEGYAKDGMVLVGLEYDRMDVVFCHGGRFWFRTIPEGVYHYLEGLRDVLDVKHRIAVKIAKGEQECPDEKARAGVARKCSERLAAEISRLVAYYRGARADTNLKGLVLIPGTPFEIPLGPELKAKTGLDVFGVKGFRRIVIDEAIITPEIETSVAALGHAAGLALQGAGKADIATRLYDSSFERVIAGRRVFYVLSIMVTFAMVAVMWIISWKEGRKLRDAQEELQARMSALDKNRDDLRRESRESELLAGFAAFRDIGRHRLTPVAAVTHVIESVDALNRGRAEDDRVYIINVESSAVADGVDRSQRLISVLLGCVLSTTQQEAEDRLEKNLFDAWRKDSHVSDLKPEASFVAPTLSLTPVAEVEGRILRRKFLMRKVTYIWKDDSQ